MKRTRAKVQTSNDISDAGIVKRQKISRSDPSVSHEKLDQTEKIELQRLHSLPAAKSASELNLQKKSNSDDIIHKSPSTDSLPSTSSTSMSSSNPLPMSNSARAANFQLKQIINSYKKKFSNGKLDVKEPKILSKVKLKREDRPVYACQCGWITRKGDRDENQDKYISDTHYTPKYVKERLSRWCNRLSTNSPAQTCAIFAVLDGHGPNGLEGAIVSQAMLRNAIVSRIPNLFMFDFTEKHIRESLEGAIKEVHERLLDIGNKKEEVLLREFGTTLIAAVLWGGNRLTVANVGDSRAILCRKSMSSEGIANWRAKPMSVDHTLYRSDEKTRIGKTKGKVIAGSNGDRRIIPCSEDYPTSVVKEQKLALAMSRSLGHVILSKYGVSQDPEFISTYVQNDDILILASDGLWSMMTNEEVLQIAIAQTNPQYVARALAREVEKRCNTKRVKSDNTTILVIKIDYLQTVEVKVDTATDKDELSESGSEDDGGDTPVLQRFNSNDNSSDSSLKGAPW